MNTCQPSLQPKAGKAKASPYPGSPQESTVHAARLTAPRLASLPGFAARTSHPSQETRTGDSAASHGLHWFPGLQQSPLENQKQALVGSGQSKRSTYEYPKIETSCDMPLTMLGPPRKHCISKPKHPESDPVSKRASYLCQFFFFVKSFMNQFTQNLQFFKALFLFNPTHLLLFR